MAKRYATVEEGKALVGKLIRSDVMVGIVEMVGTLREVHTHYGWNLGGIEDWFDRPVMALRTKNGLNGWFYSKWMIEVAGEES